MLSVTEERLRVERLFGSDRIGVVVVVLSRLSRVAPVSLVSW